MQGSTSQVVNSRLLFALFIDRVVSDCLLIENHSLTTFPSVNTETTSTYLDRQLVTWISEEIIICNGLYRRRRVLWRTGKDTFGAEFYRFSPRLNPPKTPISSNRDSITDCSSIPTNCTTIECPEPGLSDGVGCNHFRRWRIKVSRPQGAGWVAHLGYKGFGNVRRLSEGNRYLTGAARRYSYW